MSNHLEKASNCKSCHELRSIVNEQRDKIQIIEKRLRDLVKAYKAVVFERDNLLACSQLKTGCSNLSEEGEKRLSLLESNVAELSAICGKYEQQRIEDQITISKLIQKCEELELQLSDAETNKDMIVEIKPVLQKQSCKSHWTQTEVLFDEDNHFEAIEELKLCSSYTQTDNELVAENAVHPVQKSKKSELAIVMPTQREDTSKVEEISQEHDVITPTSLNSFDIEPRMPSRGESITEHHASTSAPTIFSLFYANELSRKEIELKDMKLRARELECSLRELQLKYNVDIYKLQAEIKELEKQRRQLQSDSNFHPNLTYIRNVLLRMIDTKDRSQKRFMINALLTALDVQINDS